jgi:hypothetical protein
MTRADRSKAQPIQLACAAALLACLSSSPGWTQSGLVEERISEENGLYEVCGEGPGLSPCRDINGQTYAEEVRGPSIDSESTDELAAEAARIRHESPEKLQQTIGEMERGVNPDSHATEGLPH